MKRLRIVAALSACAVMAGCGHRELKGDMTMLEVEKALGKPDRVETLRGSTDGKFEEPTVIRWHYARFPITASGAEYGRPGHVNFVPKRFISRGQTAAEADSIARQYGEQADAYRTFSYAGSFPTRKEYWNGLGPLDGLPLKEQVRTNQNEARQSER
jgi:hypothetical protein